MHTERSCEWPCWAFIMMPLLTHGRFHEQPQRQRRSHPHGSECSSSVGGTSLSLEHTLSDTKDHTALIIKNESGDILMQCNKVENDF